MTTTNPTPTVDPVNADPIGTITEAGEALRSGAVTSTQLLRQCLARADEFDDRFGVFITRLTDSALAAAAAADAELAAGHDRGPLHGIPLGIKDIIATAGGPTTAQSLILDPAWGPKQGEPGADGTPSGDAVVVERLRAAGAVIVGKAATLEFAIGIADPAKPFPVHRNPWDTNRWPGGSSSGTGAGVASGMFLGGLGTDTGGSVRIPAAFCGISGLKQTYGRVPKSGCVPLGYSLDHIGPMARSAADCAAMLSIMAGAHPSDPTSVERPADELDALHSLPTNLEGLRIGVDRVNHVDAPNVAPGAVETFDAALEALAALGATVVDVEIPYYAEGNAADIAIMVCEAAAYHGLDLPDQWEDYGVPTRQVMAWAAAYSAADYVQAQRIRSLVTAETAALLSTVDAIVHPTNLFAAPTLAESNIDNWFDWPLFTSFGNTVGLPVLSIPMGFVDAMPLGLSIMTRGFDEVTALRIGHAFQSSTDHHRATPPLVLEFES